MPVLGRHSARMLAVVYAGGVAGALLRVGVAEAFPPAPGAWPWATLAVNLAGALLLGFLSARLRDQPREGLRYPLLATGFCGALTTFSTFQLELYELVEGGDAGLALAYLATTLAAGYLVLRAGTALAARWPRRRVQLDEALEELG